MSVMGEILEIICSKPWFSSEEVEIPPKQKDLCKLHSKLAEDKSRFYLEADTQPPHLPMAFEAYGSTGCEKSF